MPVHARSVLVTTSVVLAAWLLAPTVRPVATAGRPTAAFAQPTSDSRERTFAFEGVAPGDQQAVEAAVAAAQPEAQRLVARVAGMVTVRVGSTGTGKLDAWARPLLLLGGQRRLRAAVHAA